MYDARPGRLSTSCVDVNTECVWSLVLSDHRITVHMIADQLNLGKSCVLMILTEHLK